VFAGLTIDQIANRRYRRMLGTHRSGKGAQYHCAFVCPIEPIEIGGEGGTERRTVQNCKKCPLGADLLCRQKGQDTRAYQTNNAVSVFSSMLRNNLARRLADAVLIPSRFS
jgi:hypothetical protein